ncbi:MAG TPA: hypothetical protein VMT18_15005 [Planctomycetota bacterium]|nr:hypothetical protein [Planctomycetota bacterium]
MALCVTAPLALLAAEGLARGLTWLRHGVAGDRGGYNDALVEHHPRLGWLGIPDARVRQHTTEFDVELAINALGFRQAELPASEPSPARRRVTLLGDSFVFGAGVAEDQRLGERLAASAPDLEVVSLGLPAWGTDQALLAWSELEGPHANSRLVVLTHLPEHVVRNGADARMGRAKPRFELRDGALELVGVPVPAWTEDARAKIPASPRTLLRRHSRLYALLAQSLRSPARRTLGRAEADPYPQYTDDAPSWQVTRALFAELQRRVRARGAELALVIVPEARHLEPDFGEAHRSAVLAACAELGLPALDLTPALRAARAAGVEPLYFPSDGHWTLAGHTVAARALERFLREAGLL